MYYRTAARSIPGPDFDRRQPNRQQFPIRTVSALTGVSTVTLRAQGLVDHPLLGRVAEDGWRELVGLLFKPDFIVPGDSLGSARAAIADHRLPRSPITTAYPSRRHLSAKVRAFVEFLAQRFARAQDWRLPA